MHVEEEPEKGMQDALSSASRRLPARRLFTRVRIGSHRLPDANLANILTSEGNRRRWKRPAIQVHIRAQKRILPYQEVENYIPIVFPPHPLGADTFDQSF